MIERKILIGLITQTEFLKEIEEQWKPDYIESRTIQLICNWCWEYYRQYKKAPMHDIEGLYIKKLKKGIDKDIAEEIEEDILPGLSEEYEKEDIDLAFLIEETYRHFKQRQIEIHVDEVTFLLDKDDIEEAEKQVDSFKIKSKVAEDGIDLSSHEALDRVGQAFNMTYQSVVKFPGALGDFWNDQMVRGALVSLLAPEKRGKTFWLLEFMMRAYTQKKKVVFFQAGDMTEAQQLVRIGVYLARRSNKEQYCGVRYIPIQDCIHNQKDTCIKKVRECDFGMFGEEIESRNTVTIDDLVIAYEENPDYKPCFNCVEWSKNKWGTPWLTKRKIGSPLTAREAKKYWERFFYKAGRSIRIYTYPTLTLTTREMEKKLDKLKEEEGFDAEMVLVDYADILDYEVKGDLRERENYKWMRLRALSQKTNALWIVPTQADADSYEKNTMTMKNFSETKAKHAHVTAEYGMNQDKDGREKGIGIMRFNRIAIREGDSHPSQQVNVLQHLAIGRPHLGSYY